MIENRLVQNGFVSSHIKRKEIDRNMNINILFLLLFQRNSAYKFGIFLFCCFNRYLKRRVHTSRYDKLSSLIFWNDCTQIVILSRCRPFKVTVDQYNTISILEFLFHQLHQTQIILSCIKIKSGWLNPRYIKVINFKKINK